MNMHSKKTKHKYQETKIFVDIYIFVLSSVIELVKKLKAALHLNEIHYPLVFRFFSIFSILHKTTSLTNIWFPFHKMELFINIYMRLNPPFDKKETKKIEMFGLNREHSKYMNTTTKALDT